VTIKDASGTALSLGGQTTALHRGGAAATTHYDLDPPRAAPRASTSPCCRRSSRSPPARRPAPASRFCADLANLERNEADALAHGGDHAALVETDPARIAAGSFSDTVPANLPVDGLLSYTLQLESGTAMVTAAALARGRGSLDSRSSSSRVRAQRQPYNVTWLTSGARSSELYADESADLRGPDQATTNQAPSRLTGFAAATQRVHVVVKDNRGGVITADRVVANVSPPTFNSFSADKTSIAMGARR